MNTFIEVCIDNIESLNTAIKAGAQRIELCSSLAQGGLTPSAGFAEQAIRQSSIPIYPIIRHRAGDFVFDQAEIDIMAADIRMMKKLGAPGVVVGALNADGEINEEALAAFMDAAEGIEVTFHRAFDMSSDSEKSLEVLIKHGCHRLLTSGQQATAEKGIETIRKLQKQAAGRIVIMPGAGVNADNAARIVENTGVSEIHLSGKASRPGRMQPREGVKMGANADDETRVDVTSFEKVQAVVETLQG